MDQTKINVAAQKCVMALKAAVNGLTDEVVKDFEDSVKHLLKIEVNARGYISSLINRHQSSNYVKALLEKLNDVEVAAFFRNLLIMEEDIKMEEPIPGRYAVEQLINPKREKEDQYAFWGRTFLSMLDRFSISKEAYMDRLEEYLVSNYSDPVTRLTMYSDIVGVFADEKMSYDNYMLSAYLVGFTHVKVELI
jgi:hypothetical protein